MDSSGKLGIDMIVGVAIFTISFIFVAQYVPQIFSIERGTLNLQPFAYRTAALLTEDAGYWTNGSANGTDWWNHTEDSIRIGLISGEANKLDYDKIQELVNFYNDSNNYSVIQKALGLTVPERGYDYNISLQSFSSNSTYLDYVTHNGTPVLLIGKPIPRWTDVAKYERYVSYEDPRSITENHSKLDTSNTVLYSFGVAPPVRAFVIIVTGVGDNQTASDPWMQVWFDSPNNPRIIDVYGENETIGSFDLTERVNSDMPDTVFVNVHNLKGYVVNTNAGEYVGGRFGAKLVINVW
jgi:hypothetical protein